MEKKQGMNRWQKGLAGLLAGVFCALSWTPAVYADVVTVGKDELLDRCWADLVADTAASDDEEKPKLDVTYRLTDDQRMDECIHVPSGAKVTVELEGHKIIRKVSKSSGNPDYRLWVFCVEPGGQLIVRGPGKMDEEGPFTATHGARYSEGSLFFVDEGGKLEIGDTNDVVVFGDEISNPDKGGVVDNSGTCVISFAQFPDSIDTTKGGAIWNRGKLTLKHRVEGKETNGVEEYHDEASPGNKHLVNSHARNK
ncbi:MAG: hypothetical protein LBB04_02095 [Oscillospiraceae bacterium]|nr:hypothetical protein [Oscillospiraceae bacterium]